MFRFIHRARREQNPSGREPAPERIIEAPVRSAEFTLSAEEFDVLWRRLDLEPDCKPLILHVVAGVVLPEDEARQRRARVWDDLRGRDLVDGDRVDPVLEEMVRAVATPSRMIDARMRLCGREVRAMAVARGAVGVLAWLADGTVHFDRARETGLASEITGMLPDVAAGEGRSVSIPTDLLHQLAADGVTADSAVINGLVDGGVRADDAREFLNLARGESTSSGQFGCELADSWGRPRRAGSVVGWFDTARGRYLSQSLPSGDRDYTTVSPANAKRLAQRIDELARLVRES